MDKHQHIRYCIGCDASETAGHIFGDYVTNEKDGTKTAVCEFCSAKDIIVSSENEQVDEVQVKGIMAWFNKIMSFFENFFAKIAAFFRGQL